jgi:hypothetical protein
MTRDEIKELVENAIILEGYDDCIVGVTEEFGVGNRILYSRDKILQKLRQDMSEEDAVEFYYYNIVGGYFGEQNPIFLV